MGIYSRTTGIRLGALFGRIDFLWRKTSPETLMAFLVDVRAVPTLPTNCAEEARRALVGASNGQKESALCFELQDGTRQWVSSQHAVVIAEANVPTPAMTRLYQCAALRQVLGQLEAEIT